MGKRAPITPHPGPPSAMFRITGVEVKERERKSERQARKIVKGFLAERGESVGVPRPWLCAQAAQLTRCCAAQLGDAANLQLQSVQEALQRQRKDG